MIVLSAAFGSESLQCWTCISRSCIAAAKAARAYDGTSRLWITSAYYSCYVSFSESQFGISRAMRLPAVIRLLISSVYWGSSPISHSRAHASLSPQTHLSLLPGSRSAMEIIRIGGHMGTHLHYTVFGARRH